MSKTVTMPNADIRPGHYVVDNPKKGTGFQVVRIEHPKGCGGIHLYAGERPRGCWDVAGSSLVRQ